MFAGFIFVIALGIFFIVTSVFLDDVWSRKILSKSRAGKDYPKWIVQTARFINSDKEEPVFWILWILIIAVTPLFYEFPIWTKNPKAQAYLWRVDSGTRKVVGSELLPWYGRIHCLSGLHRTVIVPPEKLGNFAITKMVRVTEKDFRADIKLVLTGSNYEKFLREVWRVHPGNINSYQDEVLVFNNVIVEIQKSRIPTQQLKDHVITIGDNWLAQKGVTSVHFRVAGVDEDPNPNRYVSVW